LDITRPMLNEDKKYAQVTRLRIDPALLATQKRILMKLIQEASDKSRPDLEGSSHKHPEYGLLWGIVELLDEIEDTAK